MNSGVSLMIMIYGSIGYGLLTIVTGIYVYHQFFWLPRVKRELFDLNQRRADRVREALASGPEVAFAVPSLPSHPFANWIDLRCDGTVAAAGHSFHPTKAFSVTARDERNLPRAAARSDGKGNVLITSHGQTFIAQFAEGQWDVRTTNPPSE